MKSLPSNMAAVAALVLAFGLVSGCKSESQYPKSRENPLVHTHPQKKPETDKAPDFGACEQEDLPNFSCD